MELATNMDDKMAANATNITSSAKRVNAVAFDHAELRAASTLGQGLYLVVSGPAPENGAIVRLIPALDEHAPEYRTVEIVSEQRPANDSVEPHAVAKRYEKSMPLAGLLGTKGVLLVGANGSKSFDLTS